MIAGVIALAAPAWADGTSRHSGTLAAIDQASGTIVVEEVGPWRLAAGETVTTRRTFTVTPETQFVRVTRAPGEGPSGWQGDYVQTAIERWGAEPGEFVTVEAIRRDAGLRAVKITVVGRGGS
jgi:hypothetical protein